MSDDIFDRLARVTAEEFIELPPHEQRLSKAGIDQLTATDSFSNQQGKTAFIAGDEYDDEE